MKNKYFIILLGIIIAGVIFYNKVYIPKITYKIINPTIGNISESVFGIGELGAKSIYNITAGVSAKVLELNADEGQWVKEGELIAILDSVDLPIQPEESKISVKKAKSELKASQKELGSLVAQKNLALVTYDRYSKLKEQSFASQSEYDKAKADLKVVKSQIEVTKAHINSAKTEIERSIKAVEIVKEKLLRFNIYAPVDGYVISKEAEVAQTVMLNQTLFKIVKQKDVWVKAYIDERLSAKIKLANKVNIKLRSHGEKVYEGFVARIVAQSDNVTQEREVDVSFKKLPLPFYINEQSEVLILVKTYDNIVKIDSKLLVYKNTKRGVWINKNNKAHFLEAKVIAINDDEVAISNLQKHTKIIVPSKSNKTLKEGMEIHQ